MQRSRRALLQRRDLEKTIIGQSRLYKVSLSLVFLLWGLVFLLSLWISHGNGFGGESPFEFLLCYSYSGILFECIPIKSKPIFLIMLYWSIRF